MNLNSSVKFGSLEEQIFLLAHAFKARGGLFLPLFKRPPQSDVSAMYRTAGLQVEGLDLSRFDLGTLYRLVRLIYGLKIQLVHWNFYRPLNGYLAALTILTPWTRHWITDHNSRLLPIRHTGKLAKKLIKKLLLRRYSKVLCVSQFVLECLETEGTWSNLSRCVHIINTDRFLPSSLQRSCLRNKANAEELFVVLAVAHLIRPKGIDVAIRALRDLPEHVVLWVIGDGEDSQRLWELSDSLSLTTRVRFLGGQRNVEPYMQAADCFVCPSVWGEAAGLVVLEALACGLPVIASAIGGIPEFLDDGRHGFLFPPGDDRVLAERIRRLVVDPEARRRIGQEARAMAVERFSIEKRLGEYLALYVPSSGRREIW